jgi:Response regulator containing CheY-like receiver, AAA-type ATPase, and DNA-binding domains
MKSIIIVDDNITLLKLAQGVLTGTYRVLLAKSGEQALKICSRQRPDLVLLDIEMPEMDGFEVLSRMRSPEMPELNRIPVVFLTAQQDHSLEALALERGACDFLLKPFTKRDLLAHIAHHLRAT